MIRHARQGSTLHVFSFPETKKDLLHHYGQSSCCLSGWQVTIFLLPWKYELSPWGTGFVVSRTDPYLMSLRCSPSESVGHLAHFNIAEAQL